MATDIVNILLTSFPGLGLPSTSVFPLKRTELIEDVVLHINSRLPACGNSRFIITTTSNRDLNSAPSAPLSSLCTSESDAFIPLRLSLPLCGGKGGFGSQLRAAGGRMSSKRKKTRGEEHGSSRNLDGRRLRTVTEAKALAEYLAVKPEMDRKEKEARRKRWEEVIELAEKREQEVKSNSKGRVDGKWIEDKEDAAERTRGAVLAAMSAGNYNNSSFAQENSSGSDSTLDNDGDEDPLDGRTTNVRPAAAPSGGLSALSYHGFDDDEFLSEESEHA